MSAVLLVPPASEPLSLADAKAFLRVAHDDDDAVITALIAAARGHVEALTRRALLTQTWRVTRDAWPRNGIIALRIGPLQSVVAARVVDPDGTAHAVDVENFVVDTGGNAIAAPSWALPMPGRRRAGIELDVLCGFGAAAGDVPDDLIQALLRLVAHWYDNRGIIAIGGTTAVLPAGVHELIAPHRMLAL